MARILGPDNGSAYVFQPSGAPAAGRTATVYSDAACTTLADIAAYQPDLPGTPGTVLGTAQVTTDANGRLTFWWPDVFPAPPLFIRFSVSGPVSRITTDLQEQVNVLAAAFTGFETTASAQAKADAAQAAAIAASAPAGAAATAQTTAIGAAAGLAIVFGGI